MTRVKSGQRKRARAPKVRSGCVICKLVCPSLLRIPLAPTSVPDADAVRAQRDNNTAALYPSYSAELAPDRPTSPLLTTPRLAQRCAGLPQSLPSRPAAGGAPQIGSSVAHNSCCIDVAVRRVKCDEHKPSCVRCESLPATLTSPLPSSAAALPCNAPPPYANRRQGAVFSRDKYGAGLTPARGTIPQAHRRAARVNTPPRPARAPASVW